MKDVMKENAVKWLKMLVEIPSFSKEEDKTGDLIEQILNAANITTTRDLNNVIAKNKFFSSEKPTILLNSHHDTVKPNNGYTHNPHEATIKDDKLFGLGTTDAGGALVCLMSAFCHFYDQKDLPFNLIFCASAEEEISGKNGMEYIFPKLGKIDFAIVGEPTSLQMAIAEKGLMVIDAEVKGKAGHAARNEGVNSIDLALQDIQWIHDFVFPIQSKSLGRVKATVTMIEAGTQHNIIPEICKYTIDVRSTDAYSNEAIFEILDGNTQGKLTARSTRLNPSSIDPNHPIVKIGENMGMVTYGSPTLSDQALMSCPSLKLGPGDSARSHTADEYIFINEIHQGISTYIELLSKYADYLKEI